MKQQITARTGHNLVLWAALSTLLSGLQCQADEQDLEMDLWGVWGTCLGQLLVQTT